MYNKFSYHVQYRKHYQAFSSRFLCVGGSSSDLLHTCVDQIKSNQIKFIFVPQRHQRFYKNLQKFTEISTIIICSPLTNYTVKK